jgi:hypothetical protein
MLASVQARMHDSSSSWMPAGVQRFKAGRERRYEDYELLGSSDGPLA